MPKTGWAAIAIGLAVIAGIYAYYRWSELVDSAVTPQPVPIPEEPAPARSQPRHPIPEPVPESEAEPSQAEADEAEPAPPPPPPLDESDAPLRQDLGTLFGERPVEAFLIPKQIVAHFVVTVDNLDRKAIPLRHWPVRHIPSQPVVAAEKDDVGDKRLRLTAGNAERYAPYVETLDAVDTERLVDAYVRYYPLFQQAYEDLGYPDRYFNDRLIEVIDHLLAAPRVEYPIELVQPEVLYEFADPGLEARSWGQKTLIRMGPAHAATVKAKLREIRAEIVSRSHPGDGTAPDAATGGEQAGDEGAGDGQGDDADTAVEPEGGGPNAETQ